MARLKGRDVGMGMRKPEVGKGETEKCEDCIRAKISK